jgi:hypothetical protein
VNYPAKASGVRRGDRVDVARHKCPGITLVHVETIGGCVYRTTSCGQWCSPKAAVMRSSACDILGSPLSLNNPLCHTKPSMCADSKWRHMTGDAGGGGGGGESAEGEGGSEGAGGEGQPSQPPHPPDRSSQKVSLERYRAASGERGLTGRSLDGGDHDDHEKEEGDWEVWGGGPQRRR